MRFDDDAITSPSDDATTPDPGGRARRRSSRPWSSPNPQADRGPGATERPASDADWKAPTSGAGPLTRTRPPVAPPILTDLAPPVGAGVDLRPVVDQLAALQAQVTALQAAVTAPPPSPDSALVTGAELAAAIEALGTALGGGMATLLTEHRNLLARDVSSAADRILEELGVRLRTATTQTVDSVEERSRHVVSRSLGELSEQVDLRLDKLQADVTGLRAVMLEIPDQTAVTDRLDQLADAVTASRAKDGGRVTPAMISAIERSVSGPLEHLEASVDAVVQSVRELLDERLPDDLAESLAQAAAAGGPADGGADAAALEALTAEITALRRRISLRTGGSGDDVDLEALAERVAPLLQEPKHLAADDAVLQIEVTPVDEPAPRVTGRRGRRTIT